MGKIFCLLGKSCSGKDTIFNKLIEDSRLNLQPIIPCTTRPKRSNETNGKEYIFIDEEMLKEYDRLGKIIEKREYDTVNGKWYYCTIDNDKYDLNVNNYIVISTLEAYQSFQKYFGIDNVISIYIDLDDGIRLERALKREMKQEQPNYNELCRRFLADNKDFSYENLYKMGITKYYLNYNLDKCIEEIRDDINKQFI